MGFAAAQTQTPAVGSILSLISGIYWNARSADEFTMGALGLLQAKLWSNIRPGAGCQRAIQRELCHRPDYQ